jgi:DNA modification methylase
MIFEKKNYLIFGSNKKFLSSLPDNIFDMCYCDPPFNSNQDWINFDETGFEIKYFKDMWDGGIEKYIEILYPTFFHIHRTLKETGSLFVHCDSFASHYIKVKILDKLFGESNFINEIIWLRDDSSPSGWKTNAKHLSKNHDTILFYSKTNNYNFNIKMRPRNSKELKEFSLDDNDGKGPYYTAALTHSNEIEKYRQKGELVETPNTKFPRYKFYLKDHPNKVDKSQGDIWFDISNLSSNDSERVNYPTQKPVKLLEKIITLVTKEGGLILDPYVGSGTSCVAARNVERYFVGIDFSPVCIELTTSRLLEPSSSKNTYDPSFIVKKYKYKYEDILRMNKFVFESVIIKEIGGYPNTKQTNDYGIDGYKEENKELVPIQVKCKKSSVGREVIDNFCHAIERDGKNYGILICFSISKGAKKEISRIKNEKNIDIKLMKIDEIFDVIKEIDLTLFINGDYIIADSISPNGLIVGYLWRINEKTLSEKSGKLNVSKFLNRKDKTKQMTVYCKVVDEACASTITSILI